MVNEIYDVAIIGGGCAGLTAAVYSARYKMKTLLITKEMSGLLAEAHKVENFPGFKSISGFELMQKMAEQVKTFEDITVVEKEAKRIVKEKDNYIIKTIDSEYRAKSLILALGLKRRKLGVKGEKEYLGKGVSYCATCDGPFFRDKIVGVVGGSDSAAQAALLISEYAKKVYIIYRKETLRCEPIYLEQIKNRKNVKIINNTNVVEIKGDKFVKELILDEGNKLDTEGLFIEIGSVPIVSLLGEMDVELDENDYIKINEKTETNIAGVFAAGDATDRPLKQAIVACGYGATAAFAAYKYVKQLKYKAD